MYALKFLLLAGLAITSMSARADATYLCQSDASRLQQLRIYELNPANRDNFHRRFQDEALRIMKRHGFNIVDMWESKTDSSLQFVYVLTWPDEASMESRSHASGAQIERYPPRDINVIY
ncbi:MAG: NIPSNAP family protein [Steroidobacteraceae bacterium]